MQNKAMLQRLVSALNLSRIDYCNAVPAGRSSLKLAPLQRVMNSSANRLVVGLGPRDRATESMKALRWISVPYRIKFKLTVMMHSGANSSSLSGQY